MNDAEVRELFCFKIGQELNWFKSITLKKSPEEIYAMAYQIDCMINIYELLLELSQQMEIALLKKLILTQDVVSDCYNRWLKQEDSYMDDLKSFLEQNMTATFLRCA